MKIDCDKQLILVWTKEETLQAVIASILENEGGKPLNAFNEHELFRLLEKYRPSLIILDAGLPQILGFEVYEIVKKTERFKDIKVILIASLPQPFAGADEYIERDRIQDLLLSKVRRLMPGGPVDFQTVKHREVGDEPLDAAFSGSKIQTHEEAKRFAKIIISDIVLYNKEEADKGINNGTFYETLKKEIEEGRRLYSDRVSSTILAATDYYDEAIEEYIKSISKLILPSK